MCTLWLFIDAGCCTGTRSSQAREKWQACKLRLNIHSRTIDNTRCLRGMRNCFWFFIHRSLESQVPLNGFCMKTYPFPKLPAITPPARKFPLGVYFHSELLAGFIAGTMIHQNSAPLKVGMHSQSVGGGGDRGLRWLNCRNAPGTTLCGRKPRGKQNGMEILIKIIPWNCKQEN